ncbi:DMT family transporter [Roseateles koreensis]|uniref:DMT family transporter n=1 Tax=Roseateles koreensis TaxID=2987526 RepID=A0ABT5KPT1_9BURK|nr:DMT family transporter [Roseateles koreensis]MDC8784465.1 DMT family transporter [Roseateles koreensis]
MPNFDEHPHPRWPALRGSLFALLAALLFGVSTPLVQRWGQGVGPLGTAALLYAGASGVGLLLRRPLAAEARVQQGDWGRLLLMAGFGAGLAPVALVWGLQHTSGTSASLMLTLEAVFTAVLARLFCHEALEKRVVLALGLLTLGGMVLAWDSVATGSAQAWGLLAVLVATAAWGLDNTLSGALAGRDPGHVVMLKGGLGAAVTGSLALLFNESLPTLGGAAGLLLIGATAYGLSLRFYLLAQRAIGAARTGSVFAFAPFVGAALAYAMGERSGAAYLVGAAALMGPGVLLHLAESHDHAHLHAALAHEHAHRHDDGHHDDHEHGHARPVQGEHSHWHLHAPKQHRHAHVPDAHHVHPH